MASSKLQVFKNATIQQGFDLVDKDFCIQIEEINSFLDSKLLTGINKFNICNNIEMVNSSVKKIFFKLEDKLNCIKMCVTLSIPKIDVKKNFGVPFQKELLANIVKIEEEAATFYDECFYYNIKRARLVAEAEKFTLFNYSSAVAEYDERFLKNLKRSLRKARDHYCTVHDVFTKNVNLIRYPNSLGHELKMNH